MRNARRKKARYMAAGFLDYGEGLAAPGTGLRL
jgi:hypothetical protein